MSTNLRLDLIQRTYYNPTPGEPAGVDRWTWRLWSGSRIVSSSGSQRYSRRIDCAIGAERGAGLSNVVDGIKCGYLSAVRWLRFDHFEDVAVRILDEREVTA